MGDTCPLWTERYALEPKGIRKGWLSILGRAPLMPRDVVLPIAGSTRKYQQRVDSSQDYFRVVEENAPKGDLWTSWSPTSQYNRPGMDWAFGDIDSPDLQDAYERARRYEEWCMVEFGVQPACIFTATKGFHMHMTHDFVEGLGTVYSDAFASLIQGSGANPDFGPLKHRKTYPRVPYCLNRKATGIQRRPMFTIPVDLTWDLQEILDASAEIRVTPFTVPHSRALGELLAPAVTKARKEHERFLRVNLGAKQGMYEDLVHAAIIFSETTGWKLVNKAGKLDGRRRLLSQLYVPGMMRQTGGNKAQVMAAAEAWIHQAGGAWPEYRRFVEQTVKDCILRDGTLRYPIGLRRYWLEVGSELRVDQSR